jgi:hypothetical protein
MLIVTINLINSQLFYKCYANNSNYLFLANTLDFYFVYGILLELIQNLIKVGG